MYHLYILLCADDSLYTGITTDLERRVGEHNASGSATGGKGRGAKYTRARRPTKLVYSQKFRNRSTASRAEARVKALSRADKLALVRLGRAG